MALIPFYKDLRLDSGEESWIIVEQKQESSVRMTLMMGALFMVIIQHGLTEYSDDFR